MCIDLATVDPLVAMVTVLCYEIMYHWNQLILLTVYYPHVSMLMSLQVGPHRRHQVPTNE